MMIPRIMALQLARGFGLYRIMPPIHPTRNGDDWQEDSLVKLIHHSLWSQGAIGFGIWNRQVLVCTNRSKSSSTDDAGTEDAVAILLLQ